MNLRIFLAVLLVYRSNFHVLHWKAYGKQFDRVHALAASNYDKLLDDADKVAEFAMRLGMEPVNYIEAIDILNDYDGHSFKVLPSNKDYDLEDYIDNLNVMYSDIISCIEAILDSKIIQDPANVGIKAELEAMHGSYDLELRYLNKRRSGD